MTSSERFKTSLRSRIILALVVIVTVTSSLFAFGVLFIKQKLEETIFGEMVHDQLDVLLSQHELGTYSTDHLFKDWHFYFDTATDALPAAIRDLDIGSHHSVLVDAHYYQIEVARHKQGKAYLTYDISEWEAQEHQVLGLLASGIGIVLIIAVFMGLQASHTILAPVRALTRRLAEFQPKQRNVRIGAEFSGNEIGLIATAFDQYLARLDQFVDRERSFTAAASHELRTPLSVLLGAIDILETQQVNAAGQRALTRIKRACGEMQAFIEATLFLSREDSTTIAEESGTSLQEVLRTLIEDNQPLLAQRNLTVSMHCDSALILHHPQSIIKIMAGNILRNAIEHTNAGSIEIVADESGLTVTDSGCGIPTEDLPHVYDRSYTTKADGTGMGLNLVKRICDRFAWDINIISATGQGTKVTVKFQPSL